MNEKYPYVLGLWDGHDSGAALLKGDQIVFAVNEERLTRRKLEIRFPEKSIQLLLKYCKLEPKDIREVSVSTSDVGKTLGRVFPATKEEYYLLRRRKQPPTRLALLKKKLKYKITEFPSNSITKFLSELAIKKNLKRLGFLNYSLHLSDHHFAHAAGAAFASGFEQCLVITLDGLGDGLSGSVSSFDGKNLKPISRISSRDSLGIFFEHVTNLMNMRELEDEGKVMALANYAFPVPDHENPLLDFFAVDGFRLKARYETLRMYSELRKILWSVPSEQFAYMAQRTLEVKILELVQNAIRETGIRKVALSGGVASNIKVNRLLKNHPAVEALYIFPHMGDGGLALGAAMVTNHARHGISSYKLDNLSLGPDYTEEEIKTALSKSGVTFHKAGDIATETARLVNEGRIVLWFQGRMELGPRALGARSILALPDSEKIKHRLNINLKRRVWYQPFCPSMLSEDAAGCLKDYDNCKNPFMTVAYQVKDEYFDTMRGVTGVDGTCRAQIIERGEGVFQRFLASLKKLRGSSVVLNTSFNIHGESVVNTPEEAISVFKQVKADYLAIGDFLAETHHEGK